MARLLSENDSINIQYLDFDIAYAFEVVKLWRAAFQRAMGLNEQNRLPEVLDQLRFFRAIDPETIRVAMDTEHSIVVGFMVLNGNTVVHLYVDIDYQGRGVGAAFIEYAKIQSPDGLYLRTFQLNKKAQVFYESHGFAAVSTGQASHRDNPWASTDSHLADIGYQWHPLD